VNLKSLVEDALESIKRIISVGISRGPIREKNKILSAIGITEIRPGDDTYIRESSISSDFITRPIFVFK